MNVQDVKLTVCNQDLPEDLTDYCYRVCFFCQKIVRLCPENARSCIRLSGKNFHCPFCLRHNFHHRSSRNVLILSYRAIIGFYYHIYYLRERSMWISEIYRRIEWQVRLGIQQPAMCYDPSSFLWFIDFNKIGQDPRRVPFEDVLNTCHDMLSVFNLNARSADLEGKMWQRYALAIEEFYRKRKRPKDRRMLIPTFSGVLGYEDSKFHSRMKKFTASSLKIV